MPLNMALFAHGFEMVRCAFLIGLGCVVLLPAIASGQSPAMPVIGFVNNGTAGPFEDRIAAFRKGLSETGYIEEKNVRIEFRWSEGNDAGLSELVLDLMRRHVSIFVATDGTATTLAVRSSAALRPAVLVMGADPVKFGIVKSINEPGGNITGV
jgi:putative ABC transport system substrate-binding protein